MSGEGEGEGEGEEECCRKIYSFICIMLCMLGVIYLIIMSIVIIIHLYEIDDNDGSLITG